LHQTNWIENEYELVLAEAAFKMKMYDKFLSSTKIVSDTDNRPLPSTFLEMYRRSTTLNGEKSAASK